MKKYVVLSANIQGLKQGDIVELTDKRAEQLINLVRPADALPPGQVKGTQSAVRRVKEAEKALAEVTAQRDALLAQLDEATAPAEE